MGKAQRDKGVRGELKVRDAFMRRGIYAERTQQRMGSDTSSDVWVPALPRVKIEVKFRQALSVHKAYDYLEETDCRVGDFPLLVWVKPRGRTLAIVDLSDLIDLLDPDGTVWWEPMVNAEHLKKHNQAKE